MSYPLVYNVGKAVGRNKSMYNWYMHTCVQKYFTTNDRIQTLPLNIGYRTKHAMHNLTTRVMDQKNKEVSDTD